MKKILIVEDEPALRHALGEKFTHEGYEVILANNGQEGLERALANVPDLVILDIVMPVMDGIATLTALREDKKTKDLPVILLSNLSDSDKVLDAMKQGVYDYLVKSDWRIEDIVIKVAEKLSDK